MTEKNLRICFLYLAKKRFKFKMNNDPETTWHSVREIPEQDADDPEEGSGVIS